MSAPVNQEHFQIKPDQGHSFYPGKWPGNRQALIGQSMYGVIDVAVFNPEGHLERVFKKDLPARLLTERPILGYDIDEEEFQQYLKRELGFTLGIIRIREFRLPEERFGVYRLPGHYNRFLKNPYDPYFTDRNREEYPSEINKWLDSGSFILEWGNYYWMDKDGELLGS
jgi:hypothetical protein